MIACKTPCNDCPFRKNSLAGWLADYTTQNLHQLVMSETPFPCHMRMNKDEGWDVEKDSLDDIGTESNPVCAGALMYMRKAAKKPRNFELAQLVSKINVTDCENILSVPEFFKHHGE